MERVLDWIKVTGEGLYIVGLDNHVGFIIYDNKTITFCHSSYYPPGKVVNQEALSKGPLTDSQYRVVGKILTDAMIEKWLKGTSFPIIYDYFRRI